MLGEPSDDPGADEPGAANDDDLHVGPSSSRWLAGPASHWRASKPAPAVVRRWVSCVATRPEAHVRRACEPPSILGDPLDPRLGYVGSQACARPFVAPARASVFDPEPASSGPHLRV